MAERKTKPKITPERKKQIARENGKRGGRPKKLLDMRKLKSLVEIQCTAEECAQVLGMTAETINARLMEEQGLGFSEFYKQHSATGKTSLRRMQWNSAKKGNVAMQIWLGKQMLGQRDNLELTGDKGTPLGLVKEQTSAEDAAKLYQETLNDPLAFPDDGDEGDVASKLH